METSYGGNAYDLPQSSETFDTEKKDIQTNKLISSKKSVFPSSNSPELKPKNVKSTPKQRAIELTKELEKTIEEMTSSVYKSEKESGYSSLNQESLSVSSFVSANKERSANHQKQEHNILDLKKNNKLLEDALNEKQQKLIDLAELYETLGEELNKKKEKVAELQNNKRFSPSVSTNFIPGQSDKFIQSQSASSLINVPTFSDEMRLQQGLMKKENELEEKVVSLSSTVKQLNEMNSQWMDYNQKKSEVIKDLEKKVKEQQGEISRLEKQSSISNDPNLITFTHAQQVYIDNEYQKLRQMADRYKDQHDATLEDARRTIDAANKKQAEAEQKISGLVAQLEQFKKDAKSRADQQQELQTALLVATRSSQKPSHDQRLINHLKDSLRQRDEELRRVKDEYERVNEGNKNLQQQFRQERSSSAHEMNVRQSLGGVSSSTTIRSGGGSYSVVNDIDDEDADLD